MILILKSLAIRAGFSLGKKGHEKTITEPQTLFIEREPVVMPIKE
ncbi:hypothetical protein [Hymenobacter lapidiphilus]|nr:hypothetical protein [Hymenobacter sp. CCM 8763]